jgi:hypothetical protein
MIAKHPLLFAPAEWCLHDGANRVKRSAEFATTLPDVPRLQSLIRQSNSGRGIFTPLVTERGK